MNPPRSDLRSLTAIGIALLLATQAVLAQTVTMSGALGDSKALLMIDGVPHTLAVGSTVKGVTLRGMRGGQADVVVGGRALTLSIGAAPVNLGGAAARSGGNEIVVAVGPGGHFVTGGAINGRAVQFMVDTGATAVSMGQRQADAIGLDWKSGQRSMSQTAGGVVPVYVLTLNSVRVGEVEVFNVGAVVLPGEMPHVLLGNSFLSRFSMRRDSDTLRLEKR
jgi:aspartyl protease family protein